MRAATNMRLRLYPDTSPAFKWFIGAVNHLTWPINRSLVAIGVGLVSLYGKHWLVNSVLGVGFYYVLIDVDDCFHR